MSDEKISQPYARELARQVGELEDENASLRAEIERLRAALEACARDYISAPGTVTSATAGMAREFRRRMEIADAAINLKSEEQSGEQS